MAKRGPQPKLFDADVRKRLCDAIRSGSTIALACKYAGLSEVTYYEAKKRHQARDPAWSEVFAEIDAAEGAGAVALIATIRKAAGTQWQAAAWILERRHRADFARGDTSTGTAPAAPQEPIGDPPAEQTEWLRWRLRDVERRISGADGIAYNQLLQHETDLRAQLHTATADTGEGRTPAQVMASEQAHAREAADVHLQVYVAEWLRRHPGVFLATSAGRIEIVA